MKEGMDMNYMIQRKKEFRNPRCHLSFLYCASGGINREAGLDLPLPQGTGTGVPVCDSPFQYHRLEV